jgi:hypothetical protein
MGLAIGGLGRACVGHRVQLVHVSGELRWGMQAKEMVNWQQARRDWSKQHVPHPTRIYHARWPRCAPCRTTCSMLTTTMASHLPLPTPAIQLHLIVHASLQRHPRSPYICTRHKFETSETSRAGGAIRWQRMVWQGQHTLASLAGESST